MNTTAETVRVGVLGPLAVTDGGGRPVRVGGQRVRALLALLALAAGRPVPAHVLIERLWPEPDDRPVDAVNALQSLVSRLRAALRQAGVAESVLESSSAGYRLAIRPEAVDAAVFEAAARAGGRALAAGDAATAARLLREALGAWRGPALADVAGEEFAAAPAARLEELRSAAELDRIEADLALGEAVAVTGELRELTAADPLAERPRALLMRALAAAGRQADALAVYAEGRELLADRLGVDPSPRLEEAHLAVLRQEIPPAVPAGTAAHSHPERTPPSPGPSTALQGGQRPSGAQRPPTSFIGRDDDVSGVLKKLAEERLVTLTGPGGVGKTRLAEEVASRLPGPAAPAGPGTPACFVALAPVSDPSEVPYAVLDALGLRERSIARRGADAAGHADPLDRVCGALADQEALLILDNCEHVIEEAAGLAARLLTDCPRTRIVATSREPLRIPGETLWVVTPLAIPPAPGGTPAPSGSGMAGAESAPAIPEISVYAAVRLFCDRAAAVLPGFALDDGNAAAVAGICRALDGMPLAIELAAPWLRTLPPAQLAGRLDDRFALLTGGSRTALPRHQTLRAVIDWSWNLLSEPERVLARRLAVFPRGATLAAAERVCADSLLPPTAVLPALSGLVSKSILHTADGPDVAGPRYLMLETVRAYGLERLAEAGEETRIRDAFAGYYLDFAETADPMLRSGEQVRWFRALIAEHDNTNAALRWAISRGDTGTALRFVRALGHYWSQRGRGEGDALASEVLPMRPPEESLLFAEARAVCAMMTASGSLDMESVRGPLTAAIADMNRFAADGQAVHPIAAMAESLLAMFDGDVDHALAVMDPSAVGDDPWLRAAARMYRSTYRANVGRMDGAEADCAEALAEFRAIGDAWGVAVTLYQMAEFAGLRGDHAAAVAVLEEAEQVGRALDAWGDLPYIGGTLAVARARAGDTEGARADLRRAERAAAGRPRMRGSADEWLLFFGAEVALRAGDVAAAVRGCEAGLAAAEGKGEAWSVSIRALTGARLAMIVLEAEEDFGRCQELLAAALPAAAGWVESPPLAAVIDAVAALALARDGRDGAEAAATLLGAAHTVRGAFDESSLVAPRARETARQMLGEAAFEDAYSRGRDLNRESAIAMTGRALAVG